MTLHNQNWITFGGEPVTGRVPTRTRVFSDPPGLAMNAEQTGFVNHAYRLFCTTVEGSAFPGGYHVQNRAAPDGTRLRMTSNAGVHEVMVWPKSKGGDDYAVYVALSTRREPAPEAQTKDYFVFRVGVPSGRVKLMHEIHDADFFWSDLFFANGDLHCTESFYGTTYDPQRNRTLRRLRDNTLVNLPDGGSSFARSGDRLIAINNEVGITPTSPPRYAVFVPSNGFAVERKFTMPDAYSYAAGGYWGNRMVLRTIAGTSAWLFDHLTGSLSGSLPFNTRTNFVTADMSGKFVAVLHVDIYTRNMWLSVFGADSLAPVADQVHIPATAEMGSTWVRMTSAAVKIVADRYVVVQRGVLFDAYPFRRAENAQTHIFRIDGGLTEVGTSDGIGKLIPADQNIYAYPYMEAAKL